ncbi:MAG: hypothetical protein COB58_09295 [Thalassobium sp.]|nr:MAG: hypothetical protein COB58_14465 [Thalassobium sp.]PHQ85475.1 MAG: hypothetical protein COB58_09295 [Thalassobium sp.]
MKKFLFACIFMLSSAAAFSATCDANGCSGTPQELFDNYYLTSIEDGQIYLGLRGDVNRNNLDCSLAEGNYLKILSTHPLFEEIYSSLLTASAMDRKIMLRIENGSVGCNVLYVRFYM